MYPVTNLVIIPLLIAEDERRREHERGVPKRAQSAAHRISPFKRLVAKQAPNKPPIAHIRRLILGRA